MVTVFAHIFPPHSFPLSLSLCLLSALFLLPSPLLSCTDSFIHEAQQHIRDLEAERPEFEPWLSLLIPDWSV